MEEGRQELHVAANRKSIGALDQKLSRPEVGVRSGRIDSELVLQPILHQLPHSLMRECSSMSSLSPIAYYSRAIQSTSVSSPSASLLAFSV
ncbi:hypothetical protein PIB30_099083 [Stylosanthes scabra]|uniref:Uncharacterized protein n=1 Tax=Stylosanthes scabra TaxID=79078 RepID=A0ABU6XX02_9FABA|nr:hypothetical protein [Stylosanthes scabra]